jgi:hypothetical protein
MKEIRKQKIKREKKDRSKKKKGQQPIWAEPEAAAHLPARTGTHFFSFLFFSPRRQVDPTCQNLLPRAEISPETESVQ